MNGAQCVAARHQTMLLAQRQRHEILHTVGFFQGISDQATHPSGRNFSTSWMNRDDKTISACIRACVRALKRLDERICHTFEAVIELDFTRNGNMHILRKCIHKPRLTKRRDHHNTRLIN